MRLSETYDQDLGASITAVGQLVKTGLAPDAQAATDLMMNIAGVMAAQPMPESVRPAIRQGAITEKRVVLRLRPYQTFETPPRHVNTPSEVETLTHSLGVSMPWK